MGEKKATRAAYGEALAELGARYPELVVLDADLSGSTMSKTFAKSFPERFFNMGIAEANMAGVAAGFAACGKKPFISSFAMFVAGRAYEQIRNSIGYPRLNVKCAGSHGGLSVGEDGATHQCLEDFALMRAIPGMVVLNPCDAHEMRLGRMAVETVTDSVPGYDFAIGKGALLRPGTDVTIAATGLMVQRALAAAELLGQEGISARVLDIHTIKPLDAGLILDAARETGCIVTSEEHSVIGGLGEAVCALVSRALPVPVIRHGVEDAFGRSGKAEEVLEAYGLTAAGIAGKAREAISVKESLNR